MKQNATPETGGSAAAPYSQSPYSHSMVPGGLEVMS